MFQLSRLHLVLAILILGGLGAPHSSAFPINQPVQTTVVEYKNVLVNHYFLTANSVEMAAIDSGAAGPGWYRTGFGFSAYTPESPLCTGCQRVSRFYGTPGVGPNSHFFTASAAEAEGLKGPGTGWNYEGVAFSIVVPDAAGACTAGLAPVYRLYNNRWMFNDSNHRYVTDAAERASMIAAGWIDEGARFCSTPYEIAFKSYNIQIGDDNRILPSAQCEDEAVHLGSCMAVNNLPVPDKLTGPLSREDEDTLYFLTGRFWDYLYTPAPGPAEFLARNAFVQPGGAINGIFVETNYRGPSRYSSINPLYQFKTQVAANGTDERVFPWRSSGPFETQVAVQGTLNVVSLETRGPDSHAYGHPTIEFIDQVSGHHLYFTMLAYGTVAGGDFSAPDVATGKVIVGTTMRDGTPFGRNLGGRTLSTPSGFKGDGTNAWIPIDFRINRDEFHLIVGAARTVDPALSSNPDDYMVDNFHFTNEVVGDGRIGLTESLSLQVLRRR